MWTREAWHHADKICKEVLPVANEQNRHDISDAEWAILSPLLPGQRGQWGGVAEDNRRFIDGLFWKLRTGAAPVRQLEHRVPAVSPLVPKRVWERLFAILSGNPDYEFLMIDEGTRH